MHCGSASFTNKVIPLPQEPILLNVSSLNLQRQANGSTIFNVVPTEKKLAFQLMRMLLTTAVPVLAVIIFTAMIFGKAKITYDHSSVAKDETSISLAVGELVASLQRERGMTAMFLSSNGKNRNAYQRLLILRQETDLRALSIKHWLPTFAVGNISLPSFKDFMVFLGNTRSHFDSLILTSTQSIDFFSKLNDDLIKWAMKSVHVPDVGRLKNSIAASDAILLATEHYGRQRALATAFFTRCDFVTTNRKWFTMLEGSSETLMQLAFNMDSMSKTDYQANQAAIPDVIKSYIDLKSCVWNMTCIDVCRASTVNDRYETSYYWYANITDYINMVHNTRRSVVDRINGELDYAIASSRFEMILYMSNMLVVSLGCIVLTIMNGFKIRKMMKKVSHYMSQLAIKTKALSNEQERANRLLHTMLPTQIADRLKHNVTIEAEFYDSVSIYFSDIVEFTQFSSRVTPHVVVDLLNSLYTLFDSCIDRYDVYKVETIGDSYMVASGLPERNGMRHVIEIARMSIEILRTVGVFSSPQLPGETIEIRVGIHTGSCVAGVVGTKMPRYCLFGDTVNTASRMETTGEPQKIHVSDVTSSLLSGFDEFHLERRGNINVKGKGSMETYWLISKKENAFYKPSNQKDFPAIPT